MMKADRHLILTGFMGSGKSSVGKELATLLRRPFIDLDEYIEKQAGLTITDIFAHQGEESFRRLEQHSLETVIKTHAPLVLATGGGTIISEENRNLLKQRGYIVFLDASDESIMKRTSSSSSRPLLLAENKKNIDQQSRQKKIKDLLKERRSFYEMCHLKILTDNLSVQQVAQMIIQQLPIWMKHLI